MLPTEVLCLAVALRAQSTIKNLTLPINDTTGECNKAVFEAIKYNDTVVSLKIIQGSSEERLANVRIPEKYYETTLKVNTTLQTLDLIGNNLKANDVSKIGHDLFHNSTLTTLRLTCLPIVTERSMLSRTFVNAVIIHKSLLTLTLTHFNIRVREVTKIARALEQNILLQNLEFDNCKAEDFVGIGQALSVNTNLKRLGMSACDMRRGRFANTIESVANALRINSSLQALIFNNNDKMDDACATRLASALPENSSLTSLELYQNTDIQTEGVHKLMEALQVNSGLLSVDLCTKNWSDRAAYEPSVANTLRINSTLTSLKFYGGEFDVPNSLLLIEALKLNTTLQHLTIMTRHFGNGLLKSFLGFVSEPYALKSLELIGNSFSTNKLLLFSKVFKLNQSITTIQVHNLNYNEDVHSIPPILEIKEFGRRNYLNELLRGVSLFDLLLPRLFDVEKNE